jgi:excisionase family DNA binding protein
MAAITPINTELTVQEAADLLNVSLSYLLQLLKREKIPFYTVGNQRKILLTDLRAYKAKINKARYQTLKELTEEAQKLDLGY